MEKMGLSARRPIQRGGGGGGGYRRRNTVSTLLYDSRLERISSHTLITPRRTHGDMYK